MNITLEERTEETVRIYFEKAKDPYIRKMLPQKANSVEEAVSDYYDTLLPSSRSFGRIIKADGKYIGDIWCYCIDKNEEPNAMLSYCVFEPEYREKGAATKAVKMFLREVFEIYQIKTVGAFTYSENIASCRVLEKSGFEFVEEFEEDGRESKYYQFSKT